MSRAAVSSARRTLAASGPRAPATVTLSTATIELSRTHVQPTATSAPRAKAPDDDARPQRPAGAGGGARKGQTAGGHHLWVRRAGPRPFRCVGLRGCRRVLRDMTTLRLGGPVGRLVAAATRDEVVAAVSEHDRAGAPVLVLAGGSNVVAADEGFPGTVVHVRSEGTRASARRRPGHGHRRGR